MVIGVRVLDNPYEASIANTTASPSGVNRYLAGPSRNTTEVNTQLMASVETSVGTAISAAPCSVASESGMPSSVHSRWVFSMVTVESSTRMPTASASPPSVMVLSVSPRKYSTTRDDRIASGIEIITTRVERQEPRKIRIISAVRPAAMAPSRKTPLTEFVTNTDWSNSSLILSPAGAAARVACRACYTPLTTASVEALPFLITLSSTERWPFSRTMFCCTNDPSRTCATSFKKMVAPLANLTGIMLRSLIDAGVALVPTVYWVSQILPVPDGSVRFWVLTALTMSSGVNPRDKSLSGSMSTMI